MLVTSGCRMSVCLWTRVIDRRFANNLFVNASWLAPRFDSLLSFLHRLRMRSTHAHVFVLRSSPTWLAFWRRQSELHTLRLWTTGLRSAFLSREEGLSASTETSFAALRLCPVIQSAYVCSFRTNCFADWHYVEGNPHAKTIAGSLVARSLHRFKFRSSLAANPPFI